ncbi:hypothetical protein LZZ90_00685 [Flavobacterium sp. SM15]|uniref:hypothetical protein n=1 Tax=Flavobacterium sp. SM15 TaxID=2908005 RepID=UPI001EDB6321|nr:hypothetical protein [Flavobacterium sp. SM15]MCG2610018.1 hypothetical protein [Flavobacterium sp. SM15]
MSLITILENKRIENYKKNYRILLEIEKYNVEKNCNWLNIEIKNRVLTGKGTLKIGGKTYPIELYYSPFFIDTIRRFDLIYIRDKNIQYNSNIHLYGDLSLCLYHPKIDKPMLGTIPLARMIPWISEWCVHYEEWKKYGVWLGREIKH